MEFNGHAATTHYYSSFIESEFSSCDKLRNVESEAEEQSREQHHVIAVSFVTYTSVSVVWDSRIVKPRFFMFVGLGYY